MDRASSRPRLIRFFLGAAAAIVLTPALVSAAQDDALARIKEAGFARVGFSNFTPWGYVSETGELSGVEPTLIRAFLESISVGEMDGVLTQFVSIIPALDAGRFDFIGAGMQIRPARCEQIAFGEPEWVSVLAFVTKKGNPANLTSLDDVKAQPSIKLGVVGGGAERGYATINEVPDSQVVVFPDIATAISGLKAGRIDVMMQTSITIRGLFARDANPELEYIEMSKQPLDEEGNPLRGGYGAIGFRKADISLIAAWNDWLKQAKESGELLRLLEPFGFTEDNIAPEGVTTAELCARK